MGGKDDVTNVFDSKEAVIITPISLEHTAILGSTRSAIAENKAGIITPGCLVVLAPQPDPDVVKVIKKICAQKQAQLIEVEKHYHLLDHGHSGEGQKFSLNGQSDSFHREDHSTYQIQLLGEHQIYNAMTAIALADALAKKGYSISQAAISEGLATAYLPGRFEIICSEAGGCNPPLQFQRSGIGSNDLLDRGTDGHKRNRRGAVYAPGFSTPGATIVLDGAHNGDSAKALANTLQSIFPDRQALFIIGVNQDKNLEEIWMELKDVACAAIATRSQSYRSVPPEEVRNRILACDSLAKVICADNIEEALEQATRSVPDNVVICLCGSLYLVAEARERLISPQSRESQLCNRQ